MRFHRICEANGIAHRLTKPNHPWINGQVERMNRTIKDANVKRFYYESHDQLRKHLGDFVAAYNFARRLKSAPRAHAIRSDLQSVDRSANTVHIKSAPPIAGTKHLGSGPINRFALRSSG